MKKCGVYSIRNGVSGDEYIGSSVDIHERWYKHRKALRTGTHVNARLQRSWDKYGEPAFEFTVVELCDRSQLTVREQAHMDQRKPQYNLAVDAAHPMLGRKHSEETLAKMRAAAAGRKVSAEARAKMSASAMGNRKRRGAKHSEETLKLYKEQRQGKALTPAQLAWRKGRPGRKLTDEAKEKLLAGQRAWRARQQQPRMDNDNRNTP